MSGHNKWSKIKHKKAASDAKKSASYSKLVKLIQVESKMCNGDVNSAGLKTAIDRAKSENMPKDNIDRAIKKGASADMSTMMHVTFEAYGPGGCALIITGLTDNNNRTSGEMKHILSKNGLELSGQGSATWAFKKNNEGDWEPKQTTQLSSEDTKRLGKVIDELEENDDVQDVFTNANLN